MTKKVLAAVLLLFMLHGVSVELAAQQGNWKIGMQYSQDYYSPANVSTGTHSGYRLEPAEFNFTAGATGQYAFSNRIDFVTGVLYSQKNFEGMYSCAVCRFIAPPEPVKIEQHYLEIPALLQYKVLDTKLDLRAEAGVVAGYKVSSSVGEAESHVLDGNKYLLTGQAGAGVSYEVAQKVGLSLSAVYKRSLNSNAGKADYTLESVGLVAGLTFSILN